MRTLPRGVSRILLAALFTLGAAWASRPGLAAAARGEEAPASLRIEAPLDQLFEKGRKDDDATVAGTLTDTSGGRDARPVPVTVALRGNTSRRETECTFPKLKVELPDGKTLKIGTHCGEETGGPAGTYGRVANEKSPLREVAVYRLLEALGVWSLKARPARVTYVYGGKTIERNAMLLEDEDEAIARIGGKNEIDVEAFTTADQLFGTADTAALAFAQALAGNFDWCLKFSERDTYRCDARRKLWNVAAVAMPGGKARPLMHDFDLAGMVTGSHRWFSGVYNPAFVPSKSEREIEVIGQLQRTRSLFPRAVLDATRRRFAAGKEAALRVLATADVDPEGRQYMREYLDAFYDEVESDERFYRPVVVAEGTVPRSGAAPAAAAVCADAGAIPIGTPVSDPLETRGDWARVILLDALWHWPPATCAPIQNGAVWIESRAAGRDFPSR